jgi:hypothetical protein
MLLVVVLITDPAFFPVTLAGSTHVDWFGYEVTAGPGIDTNTTTIRGMCAPAGATTTGVFSMIWHTVSGNPVQRVRIWVLEGSTTPTIVNLYIVNNSASGGTSFLSSYPTPCNLPWTLTVESTQLATVYAAATLTYNVTAT